MRDYKQAIAEYLQREIKILGELDIEAINAAMNAIEEAWRREATVYICGNGGSAATASHFVCDFNKGVSSKVGRKFRFACLNDNTPLLMAIANDVSYDEVFSYQLKDVMQPADLLIAISGSGNSANIIRAVDYAHHVGARVIGITGYDGGKLKTQADFSLHVPVDDMQLAEDVHMIFDHMMMQIFSRMMVQ